MGVSSRRNDRLFQNMWFRVGGSLFFHMAAASGGQGCPQPCHRPAQGQAYRGDPQVRAKCRKALSFLCFLVQSHRKPCVFKHFARSQVPRALRRARRKLHDPSEQKRRRKNSMFLEHSSAPLEICVPGPVQKWGVCLDETIGYSKTYGFV